jgi:hypothetical protein
MHVYKRHGTTTLFAALNVLEGTVIGECQPRHRHQEFLRFLNRIDDSVGAGVGIHLVLDYTRSSAGSRKSPERESAVGTFRSVRKLTKAVDDYIQTYNNTPGLFFTGAPAPAASSGRSTNIDEL